MTQSATLLVLVLDHKNRPCPSLVSIRNREDAPWHSLAFDRARGRHVKENVPVGRVEIRVDGATEWRPGHRHVELRPGDNDLEINIGPGDAHCYTTKDGRDVFYEPLPRLELLAQGPQTHAALDALFGRWPSLRPHAWNANLAGRAASMTIATPASLEPDVQATPDLIAALDTLSQPEWSPRITAPIRLSSGRLDALTNEVVVCFREEVDRRRRGEIAASHGLEIVRAELPLLRNACVMRRHGPPHHSVLALAAVIDRHPWVEFAEPNRIYEIQSHSARPPSSHVQAQATNDFLYPEQHELQQVKAAAAWNLQHGDSKIVVAVVDTEGVDPRHPNLPRPFVSWNFADHAAQTPAGLGRDHGTQCASTAVGRRGDGRGTAGIASGCSLVGARIPSQISACELADVWAWLAGIDVDKRQRRSDQPPPLEHPADVILNAWGPTSGPEKSPVLEAMLERLVHEGRKGRGCVVCFSAGNEGYVPLAAANPFAVSERVIAVGASIKANPTSPCNSVHPDPSGKLAGLAPLVDTRAYYSPFGDALDLVATSSTSEHDGSIVDPVMSATIVGHGTWISSGDTETSLSNAVQASPAAGSAIPAHVTLAVQNANGFAPQRHVLLGMPGAVGREVTRIESVQAGTLTIDPLANQHPVGTRVLTGEADYDLTFGGTSYAAATVAGAAALVLSANPDLTWQQVKDVLCSTAERIDPTPTHPDGRWQRIDDRWFSRWYGAGRLDVGAAVKLAQGLRKSASGRQEEPVLVELAQGAAASRQP